MPEFPRVRVGTLMLLVVIGALAVALVQRERELRWVRAEWQATGRILMLTREAEEITRERTLQEYARLHAALAAAEARAAACDGQ